MPDDQHDQVRDHEATASHHRGPPGMRSPRFCLEMIDAALLDTDFRYSVVEAAAPSDDGLVEEWIELAAPTSTYTDATGNHSLAVTIRVDDGVVGIRAHDLYPPGSLERPSAPQTRPDGARQVLWLACPPAQGRKSRLSIEILMDPLGRIDAILHLDKASPFNRADVPGFVRAFATAIDLAHDTLGALGVRHA